MRPGTGDYEDDPEFADDQPGNWYAVQYAPAGVQSPAGAGGSANGGYFSTLEAAVESVRTGTHGTIQWDPL